MKNKFLICIFSSVMTVSFAQYEEPYGGPINVPESTNSEESDVIDGVYVKTIVPSRSMVRYEHVRESDVVWSRRVWSYIDLREKINHPLYYPHDTIVLGGATGTVWMTNADRISLWTLIRKHVINGDITMYSLANPIEDGEEKFRNEGDSFKHPLRPQPGLNYDTDSKFKDEVNRRLGRTKPLTLPIIDPETGEEMFESSVDPETGEEKIKYLTKDTSETRWYLSENVIQYKMKEDWFFDKERSVLDVRILGICPVVNVCEDPNSLGFKTFCGKNEELFWLYFPHLRPYLSRYYTYNEQNDAQWMSFDDLFFKRRFNAVMYKESNVYDRSVESYRMGADALMEAEKIKEKIRTLEHDVWNF